MENKRDELGKTWQEATWAAEGRKGWKSFVEIACAAAPYHRTDDDDGEQGIFLFEAQKHDT